MDLARHYSRFRVTERILLTGHSHQAWPDVSFDAQQRAWLDAATLVDDKWERAAEVADDVREGWRRLLNDPGGDIALGQNTHELVVRLLSALLVVNGSGTRASPSTDAVHVGTQAHASINAAQGAPKFPTSAARNSLVTTDGEFHTIRRQVDRLEEEGVTVLRVAAPPVDTLAERLAALVDERVACVLVSSVLFETAEIVPHLSAVADACTTHGAELLVDAYHHLNAVPFDLRSLGLDRAFVTGGGYKYCQLGEGNGFLRIPPDCTLRPVFTGWFSEFAALADAKRSGEIRYGAGPARFAGATYDPTAHYRAAAVFAFHQEMGLTASRLREINRHQVRLLEREVRALDLPPSLAAVVEIPGDRRGGFLAIRSPHANEVVGALRRRGVSTDARGALLRVGPAPYVSDEQLRDAVAILGETLRNLASNPSI